MGDHSKPALTDTYANFRQYLDDRIVDLMKANDPANTTVTNQPTNSVRWNSATNIWEKWNGSAWVTLSSLFAINISGNAASATTASAAPWSGITSKPTTLAGYGITDGLKTTGPNTMTGNLNVQSGDITTYRSGATNTGVVYLNIGQTRYVYFDGTNYQLPGGEVIANGFQLARLASPTFTGTPAAPTAGAGTQTTQLATTAFACPGFSHGGTGYDKLPSGLILQWGIVTIGDLGGGGFGATTGSVSFPLAMPASIYNIQATIYDGNNTASVIVNVSNWSTTGFDYAMSEMGALSQSAYLLWFAIGK